MSVAVRHPDGSLTIDREPFPAVAGILGCAAAGFIAGWWWPRRSPAPPSARCWVVQEPPLAARVGIGDDFVRDVEAMMKPGTSVLFVLDDEGDMDVILHAIRGLGGTVLKTNVDVERAKLIQATLAGSPARRDRPRTV